MITTRWQDPHSNDSIYMNHNGDFSGDVHLTLRPENVSLVNKASGDDYAIVEIPFAALKCLVAHYVHNAKVAELEANGSDDRILGVPPGFETRD